MSLIQQNFHRWSYYYVQLLISKYLSHDRQSTLARFKYNIVLFYTKVFFNNFKSIYIKYPKYLKYEPKFELSISNDMWSYVFRSEVVSYLSFFLVTYLDYIFFSSIRKFSTYFEYGNLLESTISWLTIESNGPEQEYYLPPNTKLN